MHRYILGRLVAAIPVLVGISIVVFLLTSLLPGDVVTVMLGMMRSPQAEATLRRLFGLDQPIYIRYLVWIGNILRGDMGVSLRTGEPVFHALVTRFPVTIELTVLSLLVGLIIGIPSGIIAAVKQYSKLDYLVSVVSLSGVCLPDFLVGTLLVLVFALWLRVLPPTGYVSLPESPVQNLKLMILPAFTLGIGSAAVFMRMTRSAMLEVIHKDYIRTARAKGLTEGAVFLVHALRNALVPVVTVVGIDAGFLLSGVVIVETIFSLPGVGRLALDSVAMRDYPMVQGVVLLVASSFVLVNLAVDILYVYLDPRIRFR
jgi:peptide/nickel transport system permease protein